jgi:hypothetical protein
VPAKSILSEEGEGWTAGLDEGKYNSALNPKLGSFSFKKAVKEGNL